MAPERPAVERRILAAFDATPARVPVLIGGCGSGLTSLLLRVGQRLGDAHSQYIDAERAASTPEGFYAAVTTHTPYAMGNGVPTSGGKRGARAAFDNLLAFFEKSRAQDGLVSTFLIDEVLELRTFKSFPGLRGVMREFLDTVARSENQFVLASRYVARAHRLLRDAPDRFEVVHVPPLSPGEVSSALVALGVGQDDAERDELGRMIHALTEGRPAYVQALGHSLASMDGASSGDPVSALASQLAGGARLCLTCRFCYEVRLHRARGYGALKAILQVLANEETLTLTEIAHRLGRTPGSTKDYLSWLEDVDLVKVRQKRYSFADALLRLWVRLHCRPVPPDEADLSREVQEYAVSRLPFMAPAPAVSEPVHHASQAEANDEEKAWSIIEID